MGGRVLKEFYHPLPMPQYSHISANRLATCHKDLQFVFNSLILVRDHTILCGFRGEVEQNAAFLSGASKKRWPLGEHNKNPSMAVDAIPFPFDEKNWKQREFWVSWSQYVIGFAAGLKIQLISGYDWDGDFDLSDQTFYDGPHFQLKDLT